jgi:uncharacterized protein (DUF433 family)
MNWRDHIHSDPTVLGGKPVIRGTRISVELVLEYFADGGSVTDVLTAYPHINEEQVRAALSFAHDVIVEDGSNARRMAA